jgi:hypothetical protein
VNPLIEARVALEELPRHIYAGDVNVRREFDVRLKSRPGVQDASVPAGRDAPVAPFLSDFEYFFKRCGRAQVQNIILPLSRNNNHAPGRACRRTTRRRGSFFTGSPKVVQVERRGDPGRPRSLKLIHTPSGSVQVVKKTLLVHVESVSEHEPDSGSAD